MTRALPFEDLMAELGRVRELLVRSPLVPSMELALEPLNRAVELLGERRVELSEWERERLRREVSTVGRLLTGMGDWLTSCGALTPTYNRSAEFDGVGSRGQLWAEG